MNGSHSSRCDGRSSVAIVDCWFIDRREDQRLGVVEILSSCKILLCLGDDSRDGEDRL